MPRLIKAAAIQMEVTPAPTSVRLDRAEKLIVQAAQAGAQLIVLPELFNTGYEYADANYQRAETMDGLSVTWLKNLAARLNVHLAGSMLLIDQLDIYNRLLLAAPDGRLWHYDKNYPCAWERCYFREGHQTQVAHTDLGDIGLMICWDASHLDLWQQYAGRVDLMLLSSCPPDVTDPTYLFPNGSIKLSEAGLFSKLKGNGRQLFGPMINQQTAWLGVPLINTVASGQFVSDVPLSQITVAMAAMLAPRLLKHLPYAAQAQITSEMVQGTKLVSADGQTLTELDQSAGETFTLGEIALPDRKTQPASPQPPSLLEPLAYYSSDIALRWPATYFYRDKVRAFLNERMAPIDSGTLGWVFTLGMSAMAAFMLGRLFTRSRRKK